MFEDDDGELLGVWAAVDGRVQVAIAGSTVPVRLSRPQVRALIRWLESAFD